VTALTEQTVRFMARPALLAALLEQRALAASAGDPVTRLGAVFAVEAIENELSRRWAA
jgi:hypothetical protein